FPVPTGDLDRSILGIASHIQVLVAVEERAREDGDPPVVLQRTLDQIILQTAPELQPSVVPLVLRGTIGEVISVVVRDLGNLLIDSPGRVDTADEVAPVERGSLVELVADLLPNVDPRVADPPVRFARQ